jgi:dynein heavy chain
MRAEKKFKLAKNLKERKEEMKNFNLLLAPYKPDNEGNGPLWLVKGWDDINMILDDQTVSTQAMLGSSFMRGRLKNECRAWEAKLNHMSELMEEVLKVQKTWLYLEPIFSTGDIGMTMPLEY